MNFVYRYSLLQFIFLITLMNWLVCLIPNSLAEEPYAASTSPTEAAARFHRTMIELRRKQRRQLEQTSAEILEEITAQQNAWLQSGRETAASLDAWRSLAETWQTASDLPTAVMLALQLRSQLSAAHQKRLLELVEQFGLEIKDYRQAKRDYQRYVGIQLRQRWDKMSLDQKRLEMQSYFFLEDQRPDWLHVHRPVTTSLPLERSIKDRLRMFETKRDSFLSQLEIELTRHVQSLLTILRAYRDRHKLEPAQATALNDLIHLLEADYGDGLRGLFLCEIDAELPDELATATKQLLREHHRLLDAWRTQHAELLIEFRLGFEPLRERWLAETKLSELIAMDIAIAEQSHLLRPLRIFASRSEASAAPEDCLLRDVGERGYYVEFLRDAHRAWLPRKLVHLKPTSLAPPYPLVRPPDAERSPTRFDMFDTSGSFACYTPGGWQPCQVLDVSPFGLVVQFNDLTEPVYPLVSRDCVR